MGYKAYRYRYLFNSGKVPLHINHWLQVDINTIFCVDRGYYGTEIYKSINKGESWTKVALDAYGYEKEALWWDKTNNKIIFNLLDGTNVVCYEMPISTGVATMLCYNGPAQTRKVDVFQIAGDYIGMRAYIYLGNSYVRFDLLSQGGGQCNNFKTVDMGAADSNTIEVTQCVIDEDNDDAYYLFQWSNENPEIWKLHYDSTTPGNSTITEVKDCGSGTKLPPFVQRGIAFDGNDYLYFLLADSATGAEEVSTVLCERAKITEYEAFYFYARDPWGRLGAYTIYFINAGGSGSFPPQKGTLVPVDLNGLTTDQQVSDALRDAINAKPWLCEAVDASNGGGTSTTVTITSITEGTAPDIEDYNTGLTMGVSTQGEDPITYLYTYKISTATLTKGGKYPISLMMDRNCNPSNYEPFNREKGVHISGNSIFQITRTKQGVYQIEDIETATDFICGLSDFTAITNSGEIYEYQDISDEGIIESIEIESQSLAVTKATFTTEEIYSLNQILEVYDDNNDLLFRGSISKVTIKGDKRMYSCIGFDKELLIARFQKVYTSKTAKEIMEDLIDNYGKYLYYETGTIDSFTTTYNPEFLETTLKEAFDLLMDYENGVWWVDPDGKVYAYKLTNIPSSGKTVYKTSSSDSGNILSIPKITQIATQFNKVTLYGAVPLKTGEGYGENLEHQQLHGIQEYIDHFPHIADQTEINNLSDAILNKEGIADNPKYIKILLGGLGFLQVFKKINFEFEAYPETETATNYYILTLVYEVISDVGEYILSTGLIQEGRQEIIRPDTEKTAVADTEQIKVVEQKIEETVPKAAGKAFGRCIAVANGCIIGFVSADEWKNGGVYMPSDDTDAEQIWVFEIPAYAGGTFTLKILNWTPFSGALSFDVYVDITAYQSGETMSTENILSNAAKTFIFLTGTPFKLYTMSQALTGVSPGDNVVVQITNGASEANPMVIRDMWIEWSGST